MVVKTIDLAFSPCPNDTFIFHAMLRGLIDTGDYRFTPHLYDVEELNIKATRETYHVTKLSFFAYLKLKQKYALLDSGSAIGYGCGPLLVAGNTQVKVEDARIAIPGEWTTANLLLTLWNPNLGNVEIARFDEILPGIAQKRFDAGVIIHEGRFVYEQYGCKRIVDLGAWWESETGLPIPLGCIAIRKDTSTIAHKQDIETLLCKSTQYARKNRHASRAFIKEHAQELDDQVIDGHIDLYVNDFTVSLGQEGRKAVETLEEMARCKNIL
jgi:1,4-dihydroxy-6-naphthoate synthase